MVRMVNVKRVGVFDGGFVRVKQRQQDSITDIPPVFRKLHPHKWSDVDSKSFEGMKGIVFHDTGRGNNRHACVQRLGDIDTTRRI